MPRAAELRSLGWLLLVVALTACGGRAVDETPESAVRELIERLRVMHGDRASGEAVFALLSRSTRDNLEARARRYGAASGRNIAPSAMLAPASFLERWPARELRATIAGAHAKVELRGLSAEQRAEVLCVFEDGGWRVVLDLPPLPEVKKSPREDGPEEVGR